MYYLYEIRETDGNDATVYDCIVEAATRADADDSMSGHFEAEAKAGDWENDGTFCGYWFSCNCEVPQEPEELAIPCEDCTMASINGVPCHEDGCPALRSHMSAVRLAERWECQGHGGIAVSEDAEEFSSEADAENARAMYHQRYYI